MSWSDPSWKEAARDYHATRPQRTSRTMKTDRNEEPPPVNGPEDYGVGGSSFEGEPEKIDLPATFTFLGDTPAAARVS
jgi:hypothetical protein